MKKILVPCDFSKPAINAFRFALNIGARSKGIIHLLFVIEQPVLHDSMLMPVLSIEQDFMDDMKLKAEKNMFISFGLILRQFFIKIFIS